MKLLTCLFAYVVSFSTIFISFIERHNENPKPYRWVKSADEILASVKRFCQKTEQTL